MSTCIFTTTEWGGICDSLPHFGAIETRSVFDRVTRGAELGRLERVGPTGSRGAKPGTLARAAMPEAPRGAGRYRTPANGDGHPVPTDHRQQQRPPTPGGSKNITPPRKKFLIPPGKEKPPRRRTSRRGQASTQKTTGLGGLRDPAPNAPTPVPVPVAS